MTRSPATAAAKVYDRLDTPSDDALKVSHADHEHVYAASWELHTHRRRLQPRGAVSPNCRA